MLNEHIYKTPYFLHHPRARFCRTRFYWTFYKPLPNYEAKHELPGLQQEVDIHWDEFGVPHIYATNEQDLYYAFGYVHAQDRLWQMTLSQIAAEGRFAEFLVRISFHLMSISVRLDSGEWQSALKVKF